VKVLLSAYACLPNAGTEPGNGWNWAIHLAERGIDVHVLTVMEGRDRIEEYRQAHPNPRIQFSYVTIPTNRFKECSGMHYALWQWCAVKVAKALHKTERFDVAHHVTYGSIHVPSQLWRLGIPVVFGPVGGGQTAPASMLMHFGAARRAEQFRTLLTKALPYSPLHRMWLRKMSAVLATNRDTLELIYSMGRADAKLQFDAALPESFLAPGPRIFSDQPKPLRLLWVGTMWPRKALPLTLDVLAEVRYPSTLTIIGEGIKGEVLEQMIKDRELTERVTWAGKRLPWADVRAAYSEHDALLFTSLRDSCACQLLESMSLGLPVITLDLHGARDLVPDAAGIKVPLSIPSQIVEDVARAVECYARLSGSERTKMSVAGWEFAGTMTWNTRAKEAEHLYKKIISEREQPSRKRLSEAKTYT
jgi:glycosyltransferase involved in cell wall biosynthesis